MDSWISPISIVLSGTIVVLVIIIIIILFNNRCAVEEKKNLDCSDPMWNVMISTQNISRDGISGNLYPTGAVRIIQADKTTLNIQSRLLPVKDTFALYLQTNGSYPHPDQDYKSMLSSMTEGLHEVIELSNARTVSCGAYLHIDRSPTESASNTSTVPVGFDIAKGDVHLTVAKLEDFETQSKDQNSFISTDLKLDVDHIRARLGDDGYDQIKTEKFLRFTIIGSTKSYIVTNTQEIDSPLDALGHLIPHDSEWHDSDSIHRTTGEADATIWFDGFWKSIKKIANNTANVTTDAVNEIAHTSETIANGVSDAANTAANQIAKVACGSCKAVNGVALSIVQNNSIQSGAAAAFCTTYAAAIQAAVLPYLPECPQCEAMPISAGVACDAIIGTIASKGISLLTRDGRSEAAQMFCEKELMC